MYIAIDFDGTCVTHEFPEVGKNIGAAPVIRKLVAAGHQIILYTMRSDDNLKGAIQWFKDNQIPLHSINTNPNQEEWTSSPKCYAHVYIDDAALGIPVINEPIMCNRPYVDWNMVEAILKTRKLIS